MERVRKKGRLIDLLTERSVQSGVINETDISIYRYGLKHLFYMPVYLVSYMLVGMVTDNLFWLCMYLLAFTAIRVYAGGFHLKHRSTCYVFTMVMVCLSSVLLRNYILLVNLPVWVMLMVLGYVVIMRLAPVDNSSRVFDEQEKVYFRKIAVIIANLEFLVFAATLMLQSYQLAFTLVLAFSEEAVFLILGYWLRKRDRSTGD